MFLFNPSTEDKWNSWLLLPIFLGIIVLLGTYVELYP